MCQKGSRHCPWARVRKDTSNRRRRRRRRVVTIGTGAFGTDSYTYDAMGSVTARKLGNTTQAAYTYNGDARLATAAGATLKYNAFGQRQVETVTGGGTHFLFGPDGALLAEHNVTGALVRNYIYLNGKPLAVVDASGTVSYILTDHLGQPQKMLNASGAVTWHRVAGVYGDTVSQPVGTTSANPQRFPGQQLDATTGLHYNYYRDYDPATGRYLETDPIGLGGGVNLYAYVSGDPVNRFDRDGRIALNIVTGAIGAAVGGGTNLIVQVARNGGDFSKVNYWDVGAATVVGGVTGFVAPVAAPSWVGAMGLSGLANIAQLGLSNWINGRKTCSDDVLISAGTGALGGLVGGGVGYAPAGRSNSDLIHATGDAAVDRAMNEWRRMGTAVGLNSLARSVAAALLGNAP